MTAAEYLQTPETVLPRELAYGELRVADSPTVSHQRIVGELYLALAPVVRARQLGELLLAPMDVILDYEANLIVQPDLLFVATARSHIIADRVYGAPDLTIEVLSPHPRIGRLEERIGWFARYGVHEVWLVSLPDRQIVVLTLTANGVTDRRAYSRNESIESNVLPETGISVVNLFGF